VNFYDLEPEAQRRASAARLFRYIRDYVYPYHPYLRRLYQQHGVDVTRLRSPDDVRRLPIIDKTHLRADPQLFVLRPTVPGGPPLPDGYETAPLRRRIGLKYAFQALVNYPYDASGLVRQPTLMERIRRRGLLEWLPIHYHVSTGSTGEPTPVMFTHYDFTHGVAEMASLVARSRGKAAGDRIQYDWSDRVMSVFPGAPHVAFYAPILAKAFAGISVFETFGGAVIPTDRQISIFAKGGFTTLTAVPSYLVHWLRRARQLHQEGQIPALTRFKAVLVGAEPLSESLRRYIHTLVTDLGADPTLRVYQTFGMTELKWMCAECAEGSGLHLNPKYFYWELLHPETREPVAPGEPGVLVFSHIGWRGTAFVRFWTGDLVKGGADWQRCGHCGYMFPRIFPPICRAEKDFTKIRGTRVDLSLLVEAVRDTPGVRQCQILLEHEDAADEFSRDVMVLHIATESGVARQDLEAQLIVEVKTATEVTPNRVVFEDDPAALEHRLFAKNGIKAEYVVDRRPSRP
jgi:phenylacetate-coenzyme A ligase PaaK-like adenylate-forming protein